VRIKDVLVPVDFSPSSIRALEFALGLADPSGEIYLLHVIDADFVGRVEVAGFESAEAAVDRLRKRAEVQMEELVQSWTGRGAALQTMVVIGRPVTEILRVATDLDFEMIVLATQGRRDTDLEGLLFGSTAEKVIRNAPVPIVVVPGHWTLTGGEPDAG
jgi:universal stress protein A